MTALAMILAAAAQHGARIAIEDSEGGGVTYAALSARVREAAAGIAAGSIVELDAARTVDFVVGCLAAWHADAAWIPIDACEPAARRAAMREALAARDAALDRLAYVIATSGSSGAPKLVMIAHRGLPALLDAQIAAFALAPGDRALWLHAPRFDASVSDWGTVLAAGATLVLPSREALAAPDRLHGELAARGITHVDLPPALLAYVPPADPPPGLRVVVLGGEPCPIEPLRALARRVRVVVVYGPTEATVCSSLVVVDPARWSRPLIGDPLPGVVYQVVDGELWIGGACLALGYAGDPAATARSFVERDGVRLYRTGDRVEPADGGLAFVGRIDRQRKLAGVRIELDDLEAALRRAPGVREAAVVIAAPGGVGRARVVAYVDGDAVPADVRAWMRREAPAGMVPARVVIGALPRTPTGKIDHGALARRAVPAFRAPPDDLLAALWCEALGADGLTGERFRDAGGDSLAQLTLQAAAAARGIAIPPAAFAGNPTFAELQAQVGAPRAAITVATCEARGLAARDARVAGVSAVPAAGAAVLLTGATGQLGRAVLQAWPRHGQPIIALVRAPDAAAARRRLVASGRELEVVCGDLALPYFGLAHGDWARLADRVGSVIHAAAHIELAAGWDAHAAANVDGTAEVARLVAARSIAWHHVSTLSVFVGTDRQAGVHREAATPVAEAIAHGGYAQTKIAAEAIARASRGRSAPTTILRLGLLVGDALPPGDPLAMTLRGLARLGAVPAGGAALRLDITPLGHAAAAVIALAGHATHDDIHHIASATGAGFGQLVTAVRAAGVALVELSPQTWAERARAQLADPDIAMAYLALGRTYDHVDPAFDLFLATDADFDVARTDEQLAGHGVVAPRIDDAWLARMAAAALEAP